MPEASRCSSTCFAPSRKQNFCSHTFCSEQCCVAPVLRCLSIVVETAESSHRVRGLRGHLLCPRLVS
ncbi:hypothetical protein M3J09_007886 [Ascochyta lentis]